MKRLSEIRVPDLGSVAEARIIEILVKEGQAIRCAQGLLTVESEKASFDIEATAAGIIQTLKVQVGDTVCTGQSIIEIQTISATITSHIASPQETIPSQNKPISEKPLIYAGPGVRRLAKQLKINLQVVIPSGSNGRIRRADLEKYAALHLYTQTGYPRTSSVAATTSDSWGKVEQRPLSHFQKKTAEKLHYNWVTAPHVTHFEEVDITALESLRKKQRQSTANQPSPVKLTILSFIIKAVVNTLKRLPNFNASLSPDGQALILKQYYHIGVAVDTPQGLMVPVIRYIDQKDLLDIAIELTQISQQARDNVLTPDAMQGHSFTISSLGNIGGSYFTPIINLPDVAILGISKSIIKPVYTQDHFEPRLFLPLSLSYDHRVIDGAEAARFMIALTECLHDIKEWVL